MMMLNEEALFLKALKDDFKLYFKKCLKIRDKNSHIIPFITNPSQDKLIKLIEDWKAKYPDEKKRPTLYMIILKARQIGFSTCTEAIFMHDLNFGFNKVAMVISYDDDSASTINDMSNRFYQYLPMVIKPLTRTSRAKGLLFENPRYNPMKETSKVNDPGLQNKFLIETARNLNAGSSYTINYLHVSELAKWNRPEETMTSLLQAVPDYGSVVIVESTANGFNYFKELWDKAENKENNYNTLFIPWFEHATYRVPMNYIEKKAYLDNLLEYERTDGLKYTKIMELYGVDIEQIAWYRKTLLDKCNADVNKLKQEYPSTAEEAFLSTGSPVFNLEKVLFRKRELENKYRIEKPFRCDIEATMNLSGDPIKGTERLIESPYGKLIIYKQPKVGVPYVIGIDTAEGGLDNSVMQVLDNLTGEQVACWKGHTDTDILAKLAFSLGHLYNEALISCEVNFDTHVTKTLQRLGYYKQYMREVLDDISKVTQHKFGFRTTTATRPVIIAELVSIVREEIELINDIDTLYEMLKFERDENGKPCAIIGEHDDCILSLAIAIRARSQQVMFKKVNKLMVPKGLPEDLKQDLENDPKALELYLRTHNML